MKCHITGGDGDVALRYRLNRGVLIEKGRKPKQKLPFGFKYSR